MVLKWLFGESSRKSRRTTKKVRNGVRVNVNTRGVSLTVGGKKTRATIGRRGVKARILGIDL